ncbi:DUF4190 domain-containing protein [Cnuibacter sp. UC19_7]|uniref:DUF4190 domain-containing protein n=1 Tax=Cnuibacter sp. UC19_7 TaxID=3350166 RepID=UPI003672CF52
MTTNDSTSDDYTTEGPAVFDEASSGATPAPAPASAPGTASADRAPELVGATASSAGATQPTVPLSVTQPTVPLSASFSGTPQGGFDASTGATGAPTGVGTPGYGVPDAGAPGYSMPAAAAPATVYPPQRGTSLLAVLTLVFGILGFGVVPVVTGHIALSQLKRTGEEGRGLALAGLILGYVTLAGWVLAILAWLGVAGAALVAAFFSAIAH